MAIGLGERRQGHTGRLVVGASPRTEVDICEQQYGFMPKKNMTDAAFALRMLIEKVRGSCIVSSQIWRKLRQGVQRGTVVLHEDAWSGREVC